LIPACLTYSPSDVTALSTTAQFINLLRRAAAADTGAVRLYSGDAALFIFLGMPQHAVFREAGEVRVGWSALDAMCAVIRAGDTPRWIPGDVSIEESLPPDMGAVLERARRASPSSTETAERSSTVQLRSETHDHRAAELAPQATEAVDHRPPGRDPRVGVDRDTAMSGAPDDRATPPGSIAQYAAGCVPVLRRRSLEAGSLTAAPSPLDPVAPLKGDDPGVDWTIAINAMNAAVVSHLGADTGGPLLAAISRMHRSIPGVRDLLSRLANMHWDADLQSARAAVLQSVREAAAHHLTGV